MISYQPRESSQAIKRRRLQMQYQQVHKKRRAVFITGGFLVILLVSVVLYSLYKPLPKLQAVQVPIQVPKMTVSVTWPVAGEVAIGLTGGQPLAETTDQTPAPTASVAKVMTALMVLKAHPLKVGEQGPNVPITQHDIDLYNEYAAKDGSTLPVAVGEELSEYQALQAVMLPSANNIADTLAIWSYGSLENYHAKANEFALALKMNRSSFAVDASGFSPETTSTPHDLVLLGQAAMNNPVLKQIANQPTAELPIAGTVKNVNQLLGSNGIIGLKTGNTIEAGGCFLFAATRRVENHEVTIIGAIMKSPSLPQALASTPPLLESAYAGFGTTQVAKKGTVVAHYQVPWSNSVDAITTRPVSSFGWKGTQPLIITQTPSATFKDLNNGSGKLTAISQLEKTNTLLTLQNQVPRPSFSWRLQHLFAF